MVRRAQTGQGPCRIRRRAERRLEVGAGCPHGLGRLGKKPPRGRYCSCQRSVTFGLVSRAQRTTVSTRLLDDSDPQIRAAAVQNLSELPRRELLETLSPLLDDPIRYVRIQAALALAGVPDGAFTTQQREQRAKSLDEYRASLALNSDLAGSHMALGVLAERQGNASAAANAYRTAIRVQPDVTGPRTNLAALLEAQGKVAETEALRAEELELLARDSVLAPQSAAVQYRYGLALYLAGREQEAETALAVAYELEPNTPDYCLALALLYQKQQRFDESLPLAERVLELRPSEPGYQQLYIEIRAAAQEKDGL